MNKTNLSYTYLYYLNLINSLEENIIKRELLYAQYLKGNVEFYKIDNIDKIIDEQKDLLVKGLCDED